MRAIVPAFTRTYARACVHPCARTLACACALTWARTFARTLNRGQKRGFPRRRGFRRAFCHLRLVHDFFHRGFGLFVRGCAGIVNRVIAHFVGSNKKATRRWLKCFWFLWHRPGLPIARAVRVAGWRHSCLCNRFDRGLSMHVWHSRRRLWIFHLVECSFTRLFFPREPVASSLSVSNLDFLAIPAILAIS